MVLFDVFHCVHKDDLTFFNNGNSCAQFFNNVNNMRREGNRRLGNGNNRNAPLALPSGNNYDRRRSYNDGYGKKGINKMKRRK